MEKRALKRVNKLKNEIFNSHDATLFSHSKGNPRKKKVIYLSKLDEWRKKMENKFKEAPDHTTDAKFKITVTDVKGTCRANHKVGQKLELNCYDNGGLCGFFYHDLFPCLSGLQYGAVYPWFGDQNVVEIGCPDPYNKVTVTLETTSTSENK